MTDIVDRLRSEYPDMKDAQDGANEIVRLRGVIKELEAVIFGSKGPVLTIGFLEKAVDVFKQGWISATAENEKLREALKPFADRLSELEKIPNAAKYGASTDIDLVYLRRAREVLGENE